MFSLFVLESTERKLLQITSEEEAQHTLCKGQLEYHLDTYQKLLLVTVLSPSYNQPDSKRENSPQPNDQNSG